MAGMYDGLHVVVTGGCGALGSAVVAHVLEEGGVCHVPAFDDEELAGFAHKDHENVRTVSGVDLSDESSCENYFRGVAGDAGSIWASFHVAGGFGMGPITETSLADLEKMHKMNAATCFLSCREAVRAMRASKGGGRIVNVSARPAVEPVSGLLAYQMSKASVASLTQGLAKEVHAEGILVNAVLPSIMDTPDNRKGMPDADHEKWPKCPDVARMMGWLGSKGNALTWGALVPVYGEG